MNNRILLVDDEHDFLEILSEFLNDLGYVVVCRSCAEDALKALEKDRFDLLISDVNMPGMKGYELIRTVSALYPEVKTALLTAYDARDYFYLAKNYCIGNILTKTVPFNFEEIERMVNSLLTGDVFGLSKYIKNEICTVEVSGEYNPEEIINRVISTIPELHNRKGFIRSLDEILDNAAVHGKKESFLSGSGPFRIMIEYGTDSDRSGILVRDTAGRLTKEVALYWLERNLTRGPAGLSTGLFDNNGKGLFLTREAVDRLIINIRKNCFTEVVMINYAQGSYKGFRPLWIQEI